MRPVVGVRRVAGRQADDVTACVDTQAKYHPVGIVKVRGHLVDLENLTVVEACPSHGLDIGRDYLIRMQRQLVGVVEARKFGALESVLRLARLLCMTYRCGARRIVKQARHAGEVVIDTVVAVIQ